MRRNKANVGQLFPSTLTVKNGQTVIAQMPCSLQYRRSEIRNVAGGNQQRILWYDCLTPWTNISFMGNELYVDGRQLNWQGEDRRDVGEMQGYRVGCKIQLSANTL